MDEHDSYEYEDRKNLWSEWKQNLRLICANCKKSCGEHGAHEGWCPKNNGTYFKPYKDMRMISRSGKQ